MKKLKRFVFTLLFSKSEREIIWNALTFSVHTYKRRKQFKECKKVSEVVFKAKDIILSKEQQIAVNEKEIMNFRGEVLKGLENLTETLLNMGSKPRLSKIEDMFEKLKPFNGGLEVGATIDYEKCKVCEQKEECELYKILFKEVQENLEEAVEAASKS